MFSREIMEIIICQIRQAGMAATVYIMVCGEKFAAKYGWPNNARLKAIEMKSKCVIQRKVSMARVGISCENQSEAVLLSAY
jgi:hypothetical protein